MVIVTDAKPVSVLPSWRRTEVVLYTCRSELDEHSGFGQEPTHCHCNECGVIAMRCVKIASTGASFEDPDGLILFDSEIPKEANESDLVINLVKYKFLRFPGAFADCIITFSSGLEDMAAAGYLW